MSKQVLCPYCGTPLTPIELDYLHCTNCEQYFSRDQIQETNVPVIHMEEQVIHIYSSDLEIDAKFMRDVNRLFAKFFTDDVKLILSVQDVVDCIQNNANHKLDMVLINPWFPREEVVCRDWLYDMIYENLNDDLRLDQNHILRTPKAIELQ